jgi:putative endonuclease
MTCYIYILSSRSRAIYIGVTNDLLRRLFEHRNLPSTNAHTARYRIDRLVYFEVAETAYAAIAREKQLKGWLRAKKIALIEETNPTWDDLATRWFS